jgi:arginine-tRNA-protein transferase
MDMFGQVHSPETLSGDELDAYLEMGWFRMGQTIFTTNFLNFKNQFYSAIWLRVVLPRFFPDNTQQKLARKNAGFTTEIIPVHISSEKEALFTKYKSSVPFEASSSLRQLLFGSSSSNLYNTHEINIYDGKKLIGSGLFDVGRESAAGITSFYDPDYKKYSLGKHLIYLKMMHCKEQGLEYFYPGYFVPGYTFFDYKLSMGKSALQYLHLRSQNWLSIDLFSDESDILQVMQGRLQELHQVLIQSNIRNSILKYEFFYANLTPELKGAELFDYPVFLYCSDQYDESKPVIVVFDVRDEKYHILRCFSVWTPSVPSQTVAENYSAHLLKTAQDLFATASASDIAPAIVQEIQIKI